MGVECPPADVQAMMTHRWAEAAGVQRRFGARSIPAADAPLGGSCWSQGLGACAVQRLAGSIPGGPAAAVAVSTASSVAGSCILLLQQVPSCDAAYSCMENRGWLS